MDCGSLLRTLAKRANGKFVSSNAPCRVFLFNEIGSFVPSKKNSCFGSIWGRTSCFQQLGGLTFEKQCPLLCHGPDPSLRLPIQESARTLNSFPYDSKRDSCFLLSPFHLLCPGARFLRPTGRPAGSFWVFRPQVATISLWNHLLAHGNCKSTRILDREIWLRSLTEQSH